MKKVFLKIKGGYEKLYWIKKCKEKGKCRVHFTTLLKGSKYIHVKGDISLGENSKLLCWDEYTSGQKEQKLFPCIEIGDKFRATRNLTIQCANKVVIGKNVLLASDVFIIDYNHGLSPLSDNYLDEPLQTGEVCIGDGVWIGNNVVILPNTHIGRKSIIGAGSVVTKDIDEYCIAVGNPAKVLKKWDFDSNEWKSVMR